MSAALIKKLEGDNAALRQKADQLVKLQRVVFELYTAGFWSCDRLEPTEAKALFIRLRDAAGIAPGNSPVPMVREAA